MFMRNPFVLGALALLLPVTSLRSQSVQGPETTLPTIRSFARLSIVDVSVTDKSGKPVRGLTRNDFMIEEEKQPQTIKEFEEFSSTRTAPETPQTQVLPPHVYTNYERVQPGSALNVLLIDSLNTPLRDQVYVKSQMLQYLKSLPPGTRLAIFTLGTRLRMIQGFTSDATLLRSALDGKLARSLPSPLLDNGGDVALSDSASDLADAGAAAGLAQFQAEQDASRNDLRARITLDALNEIGSYLSSLRGRKNLIWFSGSFPLHLFPDADSGGSFAQIRDYTTEVRQMTDSLTSNQVAIYPVDARGLFNDPQLSAASARGGSSAPGGAGSNNNAFYTRSAAEQLTLQQLADATGGKAYYNTNGLKEAASKIIEQSSNYYTLAYTPTKPIYDGSFRRIRVKVKDSRYKLSYRSGYYADDPSQRVAGTPLSSPADPEDAALQRGVPASTQIIFTARVEPRRSARDRCRGNACGDSEPEAERSIPALQHRI